LDNSQFARAIARRPSATAGQTVFTYSGEMPGIAVGNAPNILNKSFTITAEIDVPEGGGEGMIVTEGGAGAVMGCTCSKANLYSTTTALCLRSSAAKVRSHSWQASTQLYSTLSMTDRVLPRAGPAC